MLNLKSINLRFVSSSDQINRHTDGDINFRRTYSFTYKVADDENPSESTTVIQSDDASNMNEGDTYINFRIPLNETLGDSKPALDETQKDSRQPLEESQVEFRSRLDNKQWIHGLSLRQQRLKLFTPYENEPQEPVDAEEEYIKMQEQLVLNERLQRLKLIRMQNTTQTSRIPVDNLNSDPHKFENMLNFSNPFQAQHQNPTLLQKKKLEEELARLNESLKQKEILRQQQQLRKLHPEQQQSQPSVLEQQQLPEEQLSQQKLPDQQPAEQQLPEIQQLPDERLPGQQIAEQQLSEKQQLPDEQLPNQELTDQPLAEQQLSDQEVVEQQLSDQEEVEQKLSDQLLTEQQLSDQEVAEQQLSDQLLAEQQLSDQEEAEQQLSDQLLTEQQLLDQLIEEQQLSDQEEAEEQLTDQEESEQQQQQQSQEQLQTLKKKKKSTTISHTHIMRQQHSKMHSKRHSKHVEDVETTTKKHKSKPIARITAGLDSDDHTERKRKRHKSPKATKSHKRKRNKKKIYKSDSSESDKLAERKKSRKKKRKHKGRYDVLKYKSDQKPVKRISSEVAGDFEVQQESFETVTELQSLKLDTQMESIPLESSIELETLEPAIESEHLEIATELQSLEVQIKPQSGALDVVNEPKSLEIVTGQDSIAVSKVTEPDLVVQPKFLEIPLVSQVPIIKRDITKTLQTMTIASMATMPSIQQIVNQTKPIANMLRVDTSVPKMTQTRKFGKRKTIRKETNLVDKLSFHEIFFEPNSIGRNKQINTFTTHILSSSMKIFDIMKEKTFEPTIRKRIDWVAASYEAKYRTFLKDLLKHPIKTRLGTQKVILNSIDESDRILQRLLNYVIADLDEKGSLRQNLNLAQDLLDEVGQERRSQLTHACKKFGICKSESGYSHFLEAVSNILLKVDGERFQRAVDAFTETTKYVHFGSIFQPKTCRLILHTVTYVEREDMNIIRTKFKIIKNIIANRNKPLIVTKSEARYCRLNSTVALLEILNILEEKVPKTDDNIVDWGDITLAFKDWSDYNKPDIQEVMGTFMQYFKNTLVQMPPAVQKRIDKYFNRIILTVN